MMLKDGLLGFGTADFGLDNDADNPFIGERNFMLLLPLVIVLSISVMLFSSLIITSSSAAVTYFSSSVVAVATSTPHAKSLSVIV